LEENKADSSVNKMTGRLVFVLGAFVVGVIAGFLLSGSTQNGVPEGVADRSTQEFEMVTHVQAELNEQDVYINRDGQAMRITVGEAESEEILDMPVYGSAEPVEPDPFGLTEAPLGPFPIGGELGFTMRDWLGATGTGTYTISGARANLTLSMEGLVPNGVYTAWCARVKLPPQPVLFDLPCGATDGSENVFRAISDGSASFEVEMAPLEESTESVQNVIAVVYHSDGQGHGPLPGAVGMNAHAQLLYLMPPGSN